MNINTLRKQILNFTFLFIASAAVAQNQPTKADMDNMRNNMMPGKMQQMMARSAGEWKAEVSYFMDPSQPAMKNTAKVKNDMMMDGRYLVTKYSGTMMGMPYEGMGIMAYDNGSKIFYSTWIDNMSTGMTQMQGTWKEEGKSIELKGTSGDPMKGKDMKVREVITFDGENSQLLEMFTPQDGKEIKIMEIRLKR